MVLILFEMRWEQAVLIYVEARFRSLTGIILCGCTQKRRFGASKMDRRHAVQLCGRLGRSGFFAKSECIWDGLAQFWLVSELWVRELHYSRGID